MRKRTLGALAALLSSLALAFQVPETQLSLRTSYGGAVLEGRVSASRNDALTGVWAGPGRARLMRCAPLCTVVTSVPVQGLLVLSGDSAYRVALAGQFQAGQKISVTLKFQNQGVVVAQAVVSRL
ncbi:hypothetical protein [Deinococcus gobiensis]|uniref:DUF5666 domain-containing protein n=1 Tax=Deinococcus gobiensis (strain DSM 21396 / JCM 16679 / CGMCC 1.7299 / I-0) TaxID=745776 RepID=H8GVR9_DEIGI|nr:hypothetical protein [Deinococcus gobiensis]AFD25631.1 hypothetical protein DGo_CA1704 [Deinococcus gobiensis I-0]